jgi:dTDP-4-dehydrorhamnose reductase
VQPILITGGRGRLGRAFARLCRERYLAFEVTTRADLDIADAAAVNATLARIEPWLVINAAGYVAVDAAEDDAERCQRDNAIGAQTLARACARHGVDLVTFSSDLVFDGAKCAPYDEADAPAPLGVYGRSKLDAEARVLDANPGALVVRTSACFGPWDDDNFVTRVLDELAAGGEVRAAGDTTVSPTYVPDLVHACLDLAIDREHGLWHLANTGATTWAGLARAAATLAGYPADRVVAVPSTVLPWRARRPPFSALRSARGGLLPPWEHALRRYVVARVEAVPR